MKIQIIIVKTSFNSALYNIEVEWRSKGVKRRPFCSNIEKSRNWSSSESVSKIFEFPVSGSAVWISLYQKICPSLFDVV